MKKPLSPLIFAALCALIIGCGSKSSAAQARTICPPVRAVTKIPYPSLRGDDPAYLRLRYDAKCESVLWEAATSLIPMNDPREMPEDERFVEADAALFILVRIYNVNLELLLPESETKDWDAFGATAYFDYVETPDHRAEVIARLTRLTRE